VFSSTKINYKKPLKYKAASHQNEQVLKMLKDWFKATILHIVVSSFKQAEIEPVSANGEVHYRINKAIARKVRHWSESPVVNEGFTEGTKKRIKVN
jgi:hypothetical protein